MKKKVAAVTVAVSLMLTGAVSAANLWGTYKGNEVIRITSNGVTVKTKDVPAISYNGRTMIPISMLGQLGLTYTWNQANKTVNFNTKANTGAGNDLPPVLSIMKANMFKDMEDLGEELLLTKAAFDLDFISKMSGVTFDSNSDSSLANAIDNYNTLIGRLDVAALTQFDPTIDQAFKYYEDAIGNLKSMKESLPAAPAKPDASAISKYKNFTNKASENISNGQSIATSGYLQAFSDSLQ